MRALPRLLVAVLLVSACGDAPDAPAAPAEIGARERAQLEALGYTAWADEEPDGHRRSGVTRHDPRRSVAGVNAYCSEPGDVLRFVDMQGEEIHRLPVPVEDPFYPDNRCKLAVPYDPHHLLVLHERTQLSLVDLSGRVVWSVRGLFHHDVARDAAGRIYTLRDRAVVAPAIHPSRRIFDVEIVVLSPEGAEERSLSLSALLETRTSARLRAALRAWWETFDDWRDGKLERTLDLFHANTIHVIERAGPLPDGEARRPGDLLLCVRNLDLVLVVDLEDERVRWAWGPGKLDRPHHPSELPGGNLLVFDNGRHREWSRLVEVDPLREEIVWEYRADPPRGFYTPTRGSAQALAGGNVLVTESDRGRVFEVTREGDVVWEFWNPDHDAANERRAVIYRMTRLAPGTLALPAPGAPR